MASGCASGWFRSACTSPAETTQARLRRPSRTERQPWRRARLRAEDEDDLGAAELAGPHSVERRDEPHAEVVAQAASFACEARLVHHDAARDLSRRVRHGA